MVNHFFGTYAIIELLMKNPQYAKYADSGLVTLEPNRWELSSWGITRFDQKLGDVLLDSVQSTATITDDLVQDGLLFRFRHKKRNISAADAIGYMFARREGLTFLTGDIQFKDLPGVEFVK